MENGELLMVGGETIFDFQFSILHSQFFVFF